MIPFVDSLFSFAAERELQPILDEAVLVLPLAQEGHAVVPASIHDGLLVRAGRVVHQVARIPGGTVFVDRDFLDSLSFKTLEFHSLSISKFELLKD